jgi:16S rRNA (adenine1518-N6/adenine1519-N6)-dimethyltransferase
MFDVPASAFTPPPKITSSIVRLVPKTNASKDIGFKVMEEITAAAFGQRRKMIRGSLKEYMDHVKFCGLNEQARAEELSVDDYIALAKSVAKARL